MEKEQIEQFFESCDTDGVGYLTLNQFEKIKEDMNLPIPDVRELFSSMDANSDGFVEQSEFVNSFNSLSALSFQETTPERTESPKILITEEDTVPVDISGYNQNNNNNTEEDKDKQNLVTPSRHRRRVSTPRTNGLRSRSWHDSRRKMRKSSLEIDILDTDKEYTANQGSWEKFAESLGEVVYALSSYEGMSNLYKTLEKTGNTEILLNYENMLQDVVREINKVQKEMSELEISFDKANDKSSQQLLMLEEEMESQIFLKEKKVREEERRKADEESEKLRNQYEQQIEQLQGAITKLKQMDEKLSSTTPFEREVETMRNRIRKLNEENSTLKSKLTESETNLVVLQNTMKEIEVSNQEKTLLLARDEDAVGHALEENDRISKEFETLYSSNRKLLDSNDNLREALENSISKMKRASQHRPHSIQLEYMTSPEYLRSRQSSQTSMRETDALAECDPGIRTPEQNGYLPPDFDSGVGTIRDEFDDSDMDWGEEQLRRSGRLTKSLRSRKINRHPSNLSYASDGFRRTRPKSHRRTKDYRTPSDDENDVTIGSDITDDELRDISQSSTLSSTSRGRLGPSSRGTPTSTRKVITPDITLGHNKRMYKVVLCGDSGVGKTSFIHRICRDEFRKYSQSTLGFDFQIKTIQLEHDRSISLQLWDTAGQERFRSISASYFRRCEGVLLLYDCTNQHSFINVRDWMETITNAVPEGVPIMVCGHKVDLRDEREMSNRPVVSAMEGAQLAAEYGVLFVETSALDGGNMLNAVTMLARHIKIDVINDDDIISGKKLEKTSEKKEDGQTCCKQS